MLLSSHPEITHPKLTTRVTPDLPARTHHQKPKVEFQVWDARLLGLLVLAGVAIAVIGAVIPARSTARLPIAEVRTTSRSGRRVAGSGGLLIVAVAGDESDAGPAWR